MDDHLVAFVGLATVLSVSPGPDMAIVLRNTLAGGWPAALGDTHAIVDTATSAPVTRARRAATIHAWPSSP